MKRSILSLCLAASLVACSSDNSESPAGAGGAAGAAGTAGGAGAAGTAGAPGDGGDPRQQAASYATETIACTTNTDCCVVFDMCMNAGYVVGVADKGAVASLLASAPQSQCSSCIPPAVQVRCGPSKTCVGVKIDCGWSLQDLQDAMTNHCGLVTLPDAGCTETQSAGDFPTPGLNPQTIFTCW